MVKALGDRFAEALAEYTHAQVRKELWGRAQRKGLSLEACERWLAPNRGY